MSANTQFVPIPQQESNPPLQTFLSNIQSAADRAVNLLGRLVREVARIGIPATVAANTVSSLLLRSIRTNDNSESINDNPNQDHQTLVLFSGVAGGTAGGITALISSDFFRSTRINQGLLVSFALLYAFFGSVCALPFGTGTSSANIGGISAVALPVLYLSMRDQIPVYRLSQEP
jgi:hypothetical protein